jgi:leucyl-tRNA synthetase
MSNSNHQNQESKQAGRNSDHNSNHSNRDSNHSNRDSNHQPNQERSDQNHQPNQEQASFFGYNHQSVEPAWQERWEEEGLFQNIIEQCEAKQATGQEIDPFYLLFAFAYPSGSGLHVGHIESKTALDMMARFYRMQGKDVFFPVGWDAFGLPAENYAIKTGVPPAQTTKAAINTFRRQIKRLGISYDWANELATCHPEYYRWTQWLFAQLFQNDLAYKSTGMVNWCPSCQTVLANEQVVEGLCERCDTQVIQKELEQWFFKITQYKDELIEGLNQVDWPAATKQHQINWIGKKEGVEVEFELQLDENSADQRRIPLPAFTTRIDTIFGATFLVISPEKFNELDLLTRVPADKKNEVQAYLKQAFGKTEEERQIGEKDKTGVRVGLQAINPVNQKQIPIFVADYVLGHVGTGVVMGVPAHDERDWEFAKTHNLDIIPVIQDPQTQKPDPNQPPEECTADYGVMINSGKYDGLTSQEGWKKLLADFPDQMKQTTNYKLRDWLISRQRYWGVPIPIIYDPNGDPHLIKDKDLPWLLPEDVDFKPSGESPLKSSQELIKRTQQYAAEEFADLIEQNNWQPDGSDWTPEFDTMDTFVDSSWYYLRYLDSRNQEQFACRERLNTWLPVDFYLIGPEHIVLHLLYSRFFTKFLRDQGYLDLPSGEPFAKMRHQGMILGPDHKKMSKSKGNVINPDEIVEKYGADTLRVYEMFMGPLEADKPWDDRAVQGVFRFLHKMYRLCSFELNSPHPDQSQEKLARKLHAAIKKVEHDIPALKFNTAIAVLMELANDWQSARLEQERTNAAEQQAHEQQVQAEQTGKKNKKTESGSEDTMQSQSLFSHQDLGKIIRLLAPFAPFMAEELWLQWPGEFSVHQQPWPEYDEELAQAELITIPVQVNGKLRGELKIPSDEIDQLDSATIIAQAKRLASVKKWLVDEEGQLPNQLKKEIYVPGQIVSLVR